jgi:hypothetical protein
MTAMPMTIHAHPTSIAVNNFCVCLIYSVCDLRSTGGLTGRDGVFFRLKHGIAIATKEMRKRILRRMSGEEEWKWSARSNRTRVRWAREVILSAAQTSEKFCGRDTVLVNYLKKYALTDADWILTVHHRAVLVGFALVQKRGSGWHTRQASDKWVKLDVLCAWDIVGLGTRVLREVERYAQAHGVQLVELHSVPNAIPFYRSRGYVNAGQQACEEDAAVTLAASQFRISEKRFKTPKQSLADPEYRRFLQTLATLGSKAGTLRGCKRIGLKRPQCSYYGYRMNRCLSQNM